MLINMLRCRLLVSGLFFTSHFVFYNLGVSGPSVPFLPLCNKTNRHQDFKIPLFLFSSKRKQAVNEVSSAKLQVCRPPYHCESSGMAEFFDSTTTTNDIVSWKVSVGIFLLLECLINLPFSPTEFQFWCLQIAQNAAAIDLGERDKEKKMTHQPYNWYRLVFVLTSLQPSRRNREESGLEFWVPRRRLSMRWWS